MKRLECLQVIATLVKDELFVTTAGGATAEWNAVRPSDGNIQVKTLGLCSSIGLGLALSLPKRKVFVFDGDQVAIDGASVSYEALCGNCYLDESQGVLNNGRRRWPVSSPTVYDSEPDPDFT